MVYSQVTDSVSFTSFDKQPNIIADISLNRGVDLGLELMTDYCLLR